MIKVWHRVHGRPIGPTFECYLEKPPELEIDNNDIYGTWFEETTLEKLTIEWQEQVAYFIESKVTSYFPISITVYRKVEDQ